MAIVTYPLNGIDYDAENAETYLCTRTSGVYSAENNFAASVTGDRQVSISKGLAWIQNTEFAGKSVCNTESVAIEIPIADGTRPRIDRIVLRFDKAANVSSIVLKQGTPSSTPAAPAVERTELVYELGLCTVLVPAASTIVGAGDVTSTLLDESVCGLMRDGVTGIPTEQLQEQTQALIDELEAEIAGIEQGSEVMLKAVYDTHNEGKDIFSSIPNPNLADNTNFRNPVNQRGFSAIEEGDGPTGNVYPYTIDRWYFNDRFGSVALIDEGVKVGASGTGLGLMQKIETDADETYTLSAKINGAVESITGNPSAGNMSSDNAHLFLGPVAGVPDQVLIGLASGAIGATVTIEWVKLEKGTFPTVWQPKCHADELLECQRYYVNFYAPPEAHYQCVTAVLLSNPASSNEIIGASTCFPVRMRKNPAVTTYGYAGKSARSVTINGVDVTVASVQSNQFGIVSLISLDGNITRDTPIFFGYEANAEL